MKSNSSTKPNKRQWSNSISGNQNWSRLSSLLQAHQSHVIHNCFFRIGHVTARGFNRTFTDSSYTWCHGNHSRPPATRRDTTNSLSTPPHYQVCEMKIPDFGYVPDSRLVWLVFGRGMEIDVFARIATKKGDQVLVAHPPGRGSMSAGSPEMDSSSNVSDPSERSKLATINDRFSVMTCDSREVIEVKEAVDCCLQLYGTMDVVVDWLCRQPETYDLNVNNENPQSKLERIQNEQIQILQETEVELLGLFNIAKESMPVLKRSSPNVLEGSTETVESRIPDVPKRQSYDDNNNIDEESEAEASTCSILEDLTPKIICMSNTLGLQAMPNKTVESAVRRGVEGFMACFNSESVECNVKAVVLDMGLRAIDYDELSRTLYIIGHSRSPLPRVMASDSALGIIKNRMRWLVEEIEDWKYLYEDE